MAHQIIKQSNGLFALFCDKTKVLSYVNLTKEEVESLFLESYETLIRNEVNRVISALDDNQPPYGDSTTCYSEALLRHVYTQRLDDKPLDEVITQFCKDELQEMPRRDPYDLSKGLKASRRGAAFSIGQKVKTTFFDENKEDWVETALPLRKKNVVGVIINVITGHGTYYDVRHEHDNIIAPYNPWELELLCN